MTPVEVSLSLALLAHPLHADPLVRGIRPDHRHLGVIDSTDACMDVLPGIRRVGPTGDHVLPGLVGQPVTDPKEHWKGLGLCPVDRVDRAAACRVTAVGRVLPSPSFPDAA
jgi:hypothetical protein